MRIRIVKETKRKKRMLRIDGYVDIVRNAVRIDANHITVTPCSLGKIFIL
jgi:hypothetical protein|tara:strand:- start:134 stop:283 length:150 start_codon:yes stop_codon:yes gene_type:complete